MRPFPWKCSSCRERAVFPLTEDYTTTVDHDGRSYQIEVPNLVIHSCQKCGKRVLDGEAEDRLMEALRLKAGLLLPSAIKARRLELGLTQKRLAELLGVAEATLSRWESGGQVQQRGYDIGLRAFFSVPEFRAFLVRLREVGLPAGMRSTQPVTHDTESAPDPVVFNMLWAPDREYVVAGKASPDRDYAGSR